MVALVVGIAIGIAVGIAVGAVGAWALRAVRGAPVEIVEGYTTGVNEAGTAIGLAREPIETGKGYSIVGAFWREAGGSWKTRGPTCLEPGTRGQHVRIGVVEVEPTGEAPGREIVVWLECLD